MTLRGAVARAYQRAREAYAKAERKPRGVSRIDHQRIELALSGACDALREADEILTSRQSKKKVRKRAITMRPTDDVAQAYLTARRKVGAA